jgi:hypothetical protein
MNAANFLAELKRRNVYKVAVAYGVVAWLLMQVDRDNSRLFEIARLLVRLDHVASDIVNANHCIM